MSYPIPMMAKMLMVIAFVLAIFGAYLEISVFSAEQSFHEIQTDYFVNHSKAERDTALVGSELNQQLAEIANYPSKLMYLKLGGIASLLAGIFIALMGIFRALTMMPFKLGEVIKK